MAVQQITGKRIIKLDTKNPNYDPKSTTKKVIDSDIIEEDIYGERKHYHKP